MGYDNPLRVAVVGTGNVASHLIEALSGAEDIDLVCIGSRSPGNAESLLQRLNLAIPAVPLGKLGDYSPELIIVSVSDSGVEDVCGAIGTLDFEPLVVHTSGTLSRGILKDVSPRTGVLYPLQSFTAGNAVNMTEVPFFLEAEVSTDFEVLERVTAALGAKFHRVDPRKRRTLHISGVFTNNFVNIILLETEKLLKTAGMDLDAVKPLLCYTVEKALTIGPTEAMTGPARRGDIKVIESQKAALPDELKNVYQTLTDVIIQEFNEQDKL